MQHVLLAILVVILAVLVERTGVHHVFNLIDHINLTDHVPVNLGTLIFPELVLKIAVIAHANYAQVNRIGVTSAPQVWDLI